MGITIEDQMKQKKLELEQDYKEQQELKKEYEETYEKWKRINSILSKLETEKTKLQVILKDVSNQKSYFKKMKINTSILGILIFIVGLFMSKSIVSVDQYLSMSHILSVAIGAGFSSGIVYLQSTFSKRKLYRSYDIEKCERIINDLDFNFAIYNLIKQDCYTEMTKLYERLSAKNKQTKERESALRNLQHLYSTLNGPEIVLEKSKQKVLTNTTKLSVKKGDKNEYN